MPGLARAAQTFDYERVNADNGKIMARGYTKHPFVNKAWKPVAVPPEVKAILLPAVRPSQSQ